MFGHMPELLIILVIALIVFGPEKLPEVASNVGRAVRDVRSALDTAMHPEDEEMPEDFSTYYYESLARAGEVEPEEEDSQDAEDAEEPWHYSIEGSEDEEEAEIEPIPIRADRPDVFTDDPDEEPEAAEMPVATSEAEESPKPSTS